MALRRRLERLAPRDPERSRLLADTARLYDVSRATLYRDRAYERNGVLT